MSSSRSLLGLLHCTSIIIINLSLLFRAAEQHSSFRTWVGLISCPEPAISISVGGYNLNLFPHHPTSPTSNTSSLYALYPAQASYIKAANITHVVSAVNFDSYESEQFRRFKHLAVQIEDDANENLLQWFERTNRFIEEGLEGGGGVFVHWYVGCFTVQAYADG